MQAVGGGDTEESKNDKMIFRSPSMKRLEASDGTFVFCFGSNNPQSLAKLLETTM